MSNMELALNMLAELTTTELSKSRNPNGYEQSADVTREGSEIVGNTRRKIEKKTGKSIITDKNAWQLLQNSEIKEDEIDK